MYCTDKENAWKNVQGAMKIAYIFACVLTFDGGEAAGVQLLFERGDTKKRMEIC